MPDFKGRCHCGQTEWTVQIDKPGHIFCHCDACKILSGGEFSQNALIPKSKLHATKGDFKCYDYLGDSGHPVHCYYCANCTSHAYHHQTVMGPDTVLVRTSLLEGSKDFPVALEVYGKNRLTWQPELAETFETVPPS
ncbi:MAG: hypothetical protein L6R42_000382 [Xanthoria sp. 1 TBL-2021]|nr:MAG: hypothetical protein L6R42_000382 [Xanthoria sp. 1 TBL-2021]